MVSLAGVTNSAHIRKITRIFCRRLMAASVLTACVFVAPALASVAHAPLNKVRVPRIDRRAIESLQRWADDEKDSWPEEL